MDPKVRRKVGEMQTNVLDGGVTITRVRPSDMPHMLTYKKTTDGTFSVVSKRPSRRLFANMLDAETVSMQNLGMLLEKVDNWNEPTSEKARINTKTRYIKAFGRLNGAELSRKSVLVIEDNSGHVVVGRNTLHMSKIAMGTMFPLYGRIVTYRQYKKEITGARAGRSSMASPQNGKYFWCNSLDCPTMEKGQWWAIHSDVRTLYTKLLDAGSALSARTFWLPDEFIENYKHKCRMEKERFSLERMRLAFENHHYRFDPQKLDIDKVREVLDSRLRLNELLMSADVHPDGMAHKRIKVLSRELRFEHRRFLRFHLSRIMRPSRLLVDVDDPNAVVVTELHTTAYGHQLRAFVLLLRDVNPLEALRVAPFN